MADGTVRVNPDTLAGAGKTSLDLKQDVLKTAGTLKGASTSAASGLAGWQTAAKLTQLASRWETLSDALGERLGRTGGNLEHNAQQYRTTEQANHAAFGG